MKYTAIVLAGSRPGGDPFARQFGTDIKALVAVAGEPMVRRPIRALLASKKVAEVIVLSQAPDRFADVVPKGWGVGMRRSAATIAETMLEICNNPHTHWPLLVTTADHALLDTATVDEFCRGATDADLAVGVVERRVLIQRFPNAERTWLKFRGGAYTGANLFALRSPKVAAAIQLWRSVEQDRKKGWRVVALIGPLVLIGALLRLLSLDNVLARLGRKLGLGIEAVRLSDPVAGVDVDKPVDHTLVEDILAGRA
ncbi:MAG TPA: NTP transferase domain-containing protein [Sphingomicrobium sp.]|nr:NTP transferase domain-containing protein [Sphingomicrobium sp.]